MVEGYVSDATIDDEDDIIVMDEPFCTITIDLDQLPLDQAVAVGTELDAISDTDRLRAINAQTSSGGYEPDLGTAELHLDVGHALTLLSKGGFVDLDGDE